MFSCVRDTFESVFPGMYVRTYVCMYAGLFVTVRAGTAYRHFFSRVKKNNYL